VSGAAIGEFELIARYFAPLAAAGGLGLTDDAACITPPTGHDLVITKDMLIADVHFFADDPPESIAIKALNVNLSDLAAKGATPLGFLLGLGRAKGRDAAWFEGFARGLKLASEAGACPLLGGDTVSAPVLTLSITAFGAVPKGRMVKRQGGKPGDVIVVSGTIGDAAIGLQLRLRPDMPLAMALDPAHRDHLLNRYLHPEPRLALREALLEHASAAMDISDGLIGDCDKLATHLGRSMQVNAVPCSDAAAAAIKMDSGMLDVALSGGDDYEILAAIPPDRLAAFKACAVEAGVAIAEIGRLEEAGAPCRWLDLNGLELTFSHRSYVHDA
jgi:thiamine-monophosphate kinase